MTWKQVFGTPLTLFGPFWTPGGPPYGLAWPGWAGTDVKKMVKKPKKIKSLEMIKNDRK